MVQKWENEACNGCTWITPTRTRIARLHALDSVASLNSAKSYFLLLFSFLTPPLQKISLCSLYLVFTFAPLLLVEPRCHYQLHCFNHHYGKSCLWHTSMQLAPGRKRSLPLLQMKTKTNKNPFFWSKEGSTWWFFKRKKKLLCNTLLKNYQSSFLIYI